MSQTFLEKYTVAPAPSRDYYGLKIQDDEIKLFHWPIRQRPHKVPITRAASFRNWRKDSPLQSEIEQIFGNSWLEYANSIIEKKQSLLTLPRKIFTNILSFLPAEDIPQLFRLSRAFCEILNNEETWEVIFKKVKGEDFHRAQKRYGMSYGWKQLLKETQDIKMESHVPKTLKMKDPLFFWRESPPPDDVRPQHMKLEVKIKKNPSRKSAPSALSLKTLELNIEEAFEDKAKLFHKDYKVKSRGVPSDVQLEDNQKSVNVLTLQSSEFNLKPKKENPEKPKTFKASPAPRSTYHSGGDKLLQSRVSSRRKTPSSSGLSLSSSLRTKERLLENSVKKSLSGFNQSTNPLSEFDWLTGSMSRSRDDIKSSDTNDITNNEKPRDQRAIINQNKRSSTMNELAAKDPPVFKDLAAKNDLNENFGKNRGKIMSKTSVSCQSVRPSSLKTKTGFDILNSEFLKQRLELQARLSGSNYSRLVSGLNNYKT
uniref:Fbxo36 protein n=1 Tax=Fopius arisanus TaxID=64838 RepID=A0A0C9PKL1_9HYME